MTSDRFDFIEPVSPGGHVLVFAAVKRPKLPTGQAVPMAHMEEWVEIIIRYDVFFSRMRIDGKHDEKHLIFEQAIFEMTVERYQGGVVLGGIGGALLKVEREKSESVSRVFFLRGSAGET